MSFQAMAWGVKQDTNNSISKLVLLMICNYANEKGEAYPSQEHLAKLCQCSRRSVVRNIQKLEKDKFISIRKEKNGAYGFNLYKLNIGLTPDWHLVNDRVAHNTQDKLKPLFFDKFWESCPRKIAKKKTQSVYNKLVKSKEVSEDYLIKTMNDYSVSVKDTELQFIVHPVTWLNQGRFDDKLEVKVKNKNWLAG